MLLRILINEADNFGLRKVSLEVRESNMQAREAYAFAGFIDRIIKKDYYFDDGEDAIEMVYSISANKRRDMMVNGSK